MAAMNRAAHVVGQISKDPSFACATVKLDTSKWSGKRRNIVLRALKDGIVQCGYDTAQFIRHLSEGYGAALQTLTRYNGGINIECVKEEEVDNLLAYTCGWVRMALASSDRRYDYAHYWMRNFLDSVDRGMVVRQIPVPTSLSDKETSEFIKQYLKDDDTTLDVRQSLIRAIENKETLTLAINAY
jgi:hypothetical protein